MSDDLVPEEAEQAYQQLLTMLRSSSQKSVQLVAEDQEQIVARVRERLALTTSTLPEGGAFTPPYQFAPHLPGRQTRRARRFVANLLAALVVIGLLFGTLTLLRVHSPSHGTPVSTSISQSRPVFQTQVDGLESTMRILISGPYFLSELLPIDVSFTNHTQRQVEFASSTEIETNGVATFCSSPSLLVRITQGDSPVYIFPQIDVFCLQPLYSYETKPGQTLTIHEYVPLTKSGEVTLATNNSNDLPNLHWPLVHIQVPVSPQIPQDRELSLLKQTGKVVINSPGGEKVHLLDVQSGTCLGNFSQWMPLSTHVLYEPACPDASHYWIYVIGAPGYAIVSGSQTT